MPPSLFLFFSEVTVVIVRIESCQVTGFANRKAGPRN